MIPKGAAAADDARAASLTLVAGALALDFANTASGRGGPQHRDHLKTGADVIAWATHAALVPEDVAARMHARLDGCEAGFARLLPDALALREAVHRIAAALALRAQPDTRDLSFLSTRCARALATATIEMGPAGARWTWPTDDPLPETILGPIALSAVGLLRESDPARLKQCPGEHCGWVFFDMTKNRSRRWCEMSVCGNRAKARTHYRRAKMLAEALG